MDKELSSLAHQSHAEQQKAWETVGRSVSKASGEAPQPKKGTGERKGCDVYREEKSVEKMTQRSSRWGGGGPAGSPGRGRSPAQTSWEREPPGLSPRGHPASRCGLSPPPPAPSVPSSPLAVRLCAGTLSIRRLPAWLEFTSLLTGLRTVPPPAPVPAPEALEGRAGWGPPVGAALFCLLPGQRARRSQAPQV